MLGFTLLLYTPIPIPSISRPLPVLLHNNRIIPSLSIKTLSRSSKNYKRLVVFAENGNGELSRDPKGGENEDDEELKSNGRPRFNLSWGDLLYPDPENILAIGLTGVLTWASVQVLWQLFFISLAILVAALKYSFIAALLIFILITLL